MDRSIGSQIWTTIPPFVLNDRKTAKKPSHTNRLPYRIQLQKRCATLAKSFVEKKKKRV
jgi:hypothetical protein